MIEIFLFISPLIFPCLWTEQDHHGCTIVTTAATETACGVVLDCPPVSTTAPDSVPCLAHLLVDGRNYCCATVVPEPSQVYCYAGPVSPIVFADGFENGAAEWSSVQGCSGSLGCPPDPP